jgi:peptidoglycan/xylan/chitin deacetylase (PgdA/CDA1 family)
MRTQRLGSRPSRGDQPVDCLTWDELGVLAAQGVTIGAHGWTHRSLGRLGPAEVRDEACRSRDRLQARLGCRVTSFAYPYGTRADFNRTTAEILAELGYTTAFTSQHGAIARGADPLGLPRIKVEGGEGLWMFRLLCHGALDGWRAVDRVLWRWQHSRRY